MFDGLSAIWLLVQFFLIITIFGFVRNWTGNTTLSFIVAGILIYLFVIKWPIFGVGWLVLSNLFILIVFVWVFFMIPK